MKQVVSTAFGLPLTGLDVLIVDDNANLRMLVRTILRSFGVRDIRQASDGTAALEEIDRLAPSLIISDWEMSPMNGREFLRATRRIGREPLCFIPVVVLTAHASRQIIEEAFDAGATQLLVKPVTPANLLQRINWVLEDDRPFVPCGDIYRQEMRIAGSTKMPANSEPAADVWAVD